MPDIFCPITKNLEKRLHGLRGEARRRGLPLEYDWIGESREGRPIFGVVAGNGGATASVTAGAHSDEPAGPLAAIDLLRHFVYTEEGSQILSDWTWHVCPHVNPDGAERNAAWFAEPPDLELYARHFHRDLPGEDVEFNYPDFDHPEKTPRAENIVVAEFLAQGAPNTFHASLHGMAFAEGAWWLIGKEWVGRTSSLRRDLAALFAKHNLGFHDIDRRGDKGFTRIEPGFSTTPTSEAMREFFIKENDPGQAALFLPSSMEYIQSLGGDPLVMVSEIPNFRIHGGGPLSDPPGDDTPFLRLRPKLASAREELRAGNPEPLRELVKQFDIRPVPFETQVEVIREGVLLAAACALSSQSPDAASPREENACS